MKYLGLLPSGLLDIGRGRHKIPVSFAQSSGFHGSCDWFQILRIWQYGCWRRSAVRCLEEHGCRHRPPDSSCCIFVDQRHGRAVMIAPAVKGSKARNGCVDTTVLVLVELCIGGGMCGELRLLRRYQDNAQPSASVTSGLTCTSC